MSDRIDELERLVSNCSDTFHDAVRALGGKALDGWEVSLFDRSLTELATIAREAEAICSAMDVSCHVCRLASAHEISCPALTAAREAVKR